MSTQEIIAELPLLSTEEREQITRALQDLVHGEQVVVPGTAAPIPQAGMHAGAWEVADDFDAPLPDEFWFGKDA